MKSRRKLHAKEDRITVSCSVTGISTWFYRPLVRGDALGKDKRDIFISKLLKWLGTKTYRLNER